MGIPSTMGPPFANPPGWFPAPKMARSLGPAPTAGATGVGATGVGVATVTAGDGSTIAGTGAGAGDAAGRADPHAASPIPKRTNEARTAVLGECMRDTFTQPARTVTVDLSPTVCPSVSLSACRWRLGRR